MSTLQNLDFDDKVALASQVINKLFDVTNKSFNNDRAGQIVEEVLNEGGYDTDTVSSDLEDINDSSIMDGIMNNITQKLRIQWTQQMSQLFYKTLNDIFTNSVTDYKKLISTEDEDCKELELDPTSKETRRSIKQFTELNSKELSEVIEYIINDMNNKNQFDMNNKKANLYYHKENIINYIKSQNWNGLFDFKTKIFRQELHKALQQNVTTVALDKLRKAIVSFIPTFDINKFNNITIRNEIIVPTSVNLKKQKQNELLDKINNKRFFEIVEQAIPMANEQISLTKINQQEVITFFKGKQGINKDIFKQLNKKTFCDKVQKCMMSRGSGAKLFKQIKDLIKERTLTDLHDDEFYFIVKQGINDINEENNKKGSGFKLINGEKIIKYFKQIGLNGGQFIESFNKKNFQNRIQDELSKGTTNKLYKYLTQTCDIEKTLSLMCDIENIENKENIKEKEIINIDISGSCKQISKLEDCNMMQLRYALLFVMIEFNKHKDKEKQISNIDNVIEFLCYKCYKQQLDAPKIAKMNLSEFDYLLHDILKVRHNPGKKILMGLRDYNFDDIPTQNVDLNLPFILIQSIREQQKKMDGKSNKLNENNILYAMQYMKYSYVEDRKKFVDFLKNECYIAKGSSMKLRDCIIRNVEKKKERYDETAIYKQQYSSIKIPRDVCDKISNQIKENFPHLYSHIIKSTTLNEHNKFMIQNGKTIRIFNCGFHHKVTNEALYLVVEPYTQFNYKWIIMKNLFTANDIMNQFNIAADKLPNSYDSNPNVKIQLSKQKDVINLLTHQFAQFMIKSVPWNKRDKIPIYNKKNNKNRVTLSLSKQQFLKQLQEAMTNTSFNQNNVIPILMKNNNDNGHHVEFVQILTIQPQCDIGIAYVFDENNQMKVSGIHTDGEFIRSQHQLLFPGNECDILDRFTCVYDHLTIGNPDLYKNGMERYEKIYKNKCEKVTNFMSDSIKYFTKMISNVANFTKENVQMWINKARIALKNKKNKDYSLDLSQLYDDKHVSNFQILMDSPLYIKDLQEINNWYFMQTLHPKPQPIVPHAKHKQTHPPLIKSIPVVIK